MDEFRVTPNNVDTNKNILRGNQCQVQIKHAAPSCMTKTPCLMTTNREISFGINPEDAEALQARCHYLKLNPGNVRATQEFLQNAVQPNPQMWVFGYDLLYDSEEFDVLREMNWPDDIDSYQFLHGLPSLSDNPLEPFQYWVPVSN